MDTLTLVWWLGAVALVALAIAVMTIRRKREKDRLEAKRLLDAAEREHRATERAPLAGPAPAWMPPRVPLAPRAAPAPIRRSNPSGALGRSGRRSGGPSGYQPGSSGYVPGVSDGGWSGGYDGGSSSGSSDSGGGSCGGGGGGGE